MQDFLLSYEGLLVCGAIAGLTGGFIGGRIGHRNGFDAGRAFMIQARARAGATLDSVVPTPLMPAPPRTRDPWRMTPEEAFNLAVNPEPAKVGEGGQFVPETPALGDRRIVEVVALDPPLYRLDQYDENDNRFARWSALPVGRAANGLFESINVARKAMEGPKVKEYSRVSVVAPEAPDNGAADFPDETAPAKIGYWVMQNVIVDGKWHVFYGISRRAASVVGPFNTQDEAQAEAAALDELKSLTMEQLIERGFQIGSSSLNA